MLPIFFLLFVSPAVGLQCLHSICSMDETEVGKCRSSHPQDGVKADCSQGSRCGLKIRITNQTNGVHDFHYDHAKPTSNPEATVGTFAIANMEIVSTYRVFYERLCVNDPSHCHEKWDCNITMNGERDCRQTSCCSTPLCNGNPFVLDNSLLGRFVNGDNLDENATVPTVSGRFGRTADVQHLTPSKSGDINGDNSTASTVSGRFARTTVVQDLTPSKSGDINRSSALVYVSDSLAIALLLSMQLLLIR
ncbi:uncharacterized protein LOC134188189 [Corticium candelabrum]|uniref:uncharacterized protein LOC134188189 n=1 Tax=Corticium candelabrum TaxID=121492 RepID=UPI002E262833|nr:uncharacterized protein LOC134188189 [Corticium candelabrum]